jgi:thioredoxin reductase (NADPH)
VIDHDVVVVGAGLAGLTASLYAARFGLRPLLVEQMAAGGQVVNVERIETYPGFPEGISGFQLGPLVQEQAEAAGAEFAMDTAIGLERSDGDGLLVRGAADEYATRAVIIATGSSLRHLGIPGEEDFVGRGVSYCASCDGPFFVGKQVCVVGGGDSALDEAGVLAELGVERVLLVHRGPSFRAQAVIADRVRALANIEPLFETELAEIHGDGSVSDVVLRQRGNTRTETVAGVFIFVGLDPNSGWLRGVVEMDASGHVVTDAWLQTSLPGVFAAGDIRQHSAAQLVAAAGDGAAAAVAAAQFLNRR